MNAATSTQTTAVTLASEVLGEPLAEWVTRHRTLGQSWARVSRDLARETSGKCHVSKELLRRHYGHIPREPLDIPA